MSLSLPFHVRCPSRQVLHRPGTCECLRRRRRAWPYFLRTERLPSQQDRHSQGTHGRAQGRAGSLLRRFPGLRSPRRDPLNPHLPNLCPKYVTNIKAHEASPLTLAYNDWFPTSPDWCQIVTELGIFPYIRAYFHVPKYHF
jgi:hypothetical protein